MEKGQTEIEKSKSNENLTLNKISFINPKKKLLKQM